jgi:hypothetical protein
MVQLGGWDRYRALRLAVRKANAWTSVRTRPSWELT